MFGFIGDAFDAVSDFFTGSSSSDAYSKGIQGPAMRDGSFSQPFDLGNTLIGRNLDGIGGALNFGRQAYNLFNSNNAKQGVRNDILGAYERAMLAGDAYQQQLAAYNQQQAAGAAAAARRTQAAQQKAAKKALKIQQKYLNNLIGQYQPYADAAKMLTPKMAENYKQYLDTTGLLNAYLAPKVMDQLGQPPKPAFSYSIPESAYSTPVVKPEAVSFPTVEEMLKKGK